MSQTKRTFFQSLTSATSLAWCEPHWPKPEPKWETGQMESAVSLTFHWHRMTRSHQTARSDRCTWSHAEECRDYAGFSTQSGTRSLQNTNVFFYKTDIRAVVPFMQQLMCPGLKQWTPCWVIVNCTKRVTLHNTPLCNNSLSLVPQITLSTTLETLTSTNLRWTNPTWMWSSLALWVQQIRCCLGQ